MPSNFRNNAAQHRYELEVDGHVAFIKYDLKPGAITFIHTEVPKEVGGRGIGSALARNALEDVRRQGLKLAVQCPFIKAFMGKHLEFNDLMA